MVFSILVFLSGPFLPRLTGIGVFHSILIFLTLSMPFSFGGMIISICLTKISRNIGKMYAFDLLGAGIAALLIIPILDRVDAISAVFLIAFISLFASYLLKYQKMTFVQIRVYLVCLILTVSLFCCNVIFKVFKVEWVHLRLDRPLIELWSSMGRVTVYPPRKKLIPFSWGLSSNYKPTHLIVESKIVLDGVCETVMTLFDRKHPELVDHLLYDVTFIGNHLKKSGSIFIIGAGGGRDILAAYLSGKKRIVAVEINRNIIDLLKRGPFADFTGHLDKLPGVQLIHGEARNVLATANEKFDIIQASCIATWSATAAGAFSLAENSLYTKEAWKIFLEHINDDGILSFNRWFSLDYPAQLLRLTSLAASTLKEYFNIKDPGKHIIIIRNKITPGRPSPSATILVSKKPISNKLLKSIYHIATKYDFIVEYSPNKRNNIFGEVIKNTDNKSFYSNQPLDISPTSDNRPYFFHMLKFKDAFNFRKRIVFREQRFNFIAMRILIVLLLTSIILSIIFIVVPPVIFIKNKKLKISRILYIFSFFFIFIGMGFIMVELSFIQRLVVFLGHPTYSVTVVLFSLLISSGIGSILSDRWIEKFDSSFLFSMPVLFVAVLGCILIYIMPNILSAYSSKSLFIRIGIALFMLFTIGFFMGFPFPIGMYLTNKHIPEHAPWLWAVNGATSVVASVLATVLSIFYGISFTFTIGVFSYLLAWLILLLSIVVRLRI